jgi:hypothetical protein
MWLATCKHSSHFSEVSLTKKGCFVASTPGSVIFVFYKRFDIIHGPESLNILFKWVQNIQNNVIGTLALSMAKNVTTHIKKFSILRC